MLTFECAEIAAANDLRITCQKKRHFKLAIFRKSVMVHRCFMNELGSSANRVAANILFIKGVDNPGGIGS